MMKGYNLRYPSSAIICVNMFFMASTPISLILSCVKWIIFSGIIACYLLTQKWFFVFILSVNLELYKYC